MHEAGNKLVSYLTYSSTLQMEVICSCETFNGFCWTTKAELFTATKVRISNKKMQAVLFILTASVVWRSESLAKDTEVPGSIAGTTKFSEK
jgi:hypothetical protein